MPSPPFVVDVARKIPSWNPSGGRAELAAFVRNVRAALIVLVAGQRGAAVARAAFEHRLVDPQDPEKRASFDGLAAQERAALAQLAAQVQSEAERRGLIAAASEAGVKGEVRGR